VQREPTATVVTHIVAVGNHGRGPVGPCGRDRQILFDYHPGVRVIVPTREGVRSVEIADLLPLASAWSFADGSTMA
jgi:cytidine deaminase